MPTLSTSHETGLSQDLIQVFDDLSGPHPGFRPTHAKGILLSGAFHPADQGKHLTCAAHVLRESTPVWVRFSDFGGVPNIPDNSPDASPRGMAIRFHLAEHTHTDIVAHSVNGFPTRTAEEFLAFLQAIHQSGAGAPHPTPIESFLASHPAALSFVQTPKPMPVSFAKQCYFAVNAYRFTNTDGDQQFGRYQIVPEGGPEFFTDAEAATQEPDYLRRELLNRLAAGPLRFVIAVQLAGPSDVVDDSTIAWPDQRPMAELGTLILDNLVPYNDDEQQHIIFDPIPRLAGIEPSDDPLLAPRADTYLMSGRRRRAATRTETA